MNRSLDPALLKAASGVFEELAFLLPSRELADHQQTALFHMAAVVGFHGPISGRLVIQMYGNVVPILAANMLGEGDPATDLQQRDALKELTNVVCGNLLPDLAGAETVYRIAAPCILDAPDLAGAIPGEPAAQLTIGMEEGRAVLQLFMCSEAKDSEPGP